MLANGVPTEAQSVQRHLWQKQYNEFAWTRYRSNSPETASAN
jgi:hypothetical protein